MRLTTKKKTVLSLCTLAPMLMPYGFSPSAFANTSFDDEPIEHYLVTGSRIKRTELEGPNAVSIISAQDIKAQGFNTVYEALQSFNGATGDTRGQALGGTNQNAETINLRGLGANRTLFLLNGKRIANYPRVQDGDYNVFNIASIPMAAVERIEINMTAGSSIYGSDAMAGVVNIITKQGIDDTVINARVAESGHGDATNKRFSVVTGSAAKSHSWTFALEYEDQDMLVGKQRDWLDDRFDTPADLASQNEFRTQLPRALSVFQLPVGADDFTSLDPTAATCDQFDNLTYTSISFLGYYCGRDNTGDETLIHARQNVSAYFNGDYNLSPQHSISTDILFWHSDASRVDGKSWSSDFLRPDLTQNVSGDGIFTVADGTQYMIMRDFQTEELLGGRGQEQSFEETMFNLSVTLSGQIFNDYSYEAYVAHSFAQTEQRSYQLKTESASDYFVTHNSATNELFLDLDHWWQPLDEAGFHTIFGLDNSVSDSHVTSAGITLWGDLVDLTHGAVQFASFVEFESAGYDLNEHPRTLGQEGLGWVGRTGTAGSGDRNRYAIGTELNIPLHDTFTVSASARYDRYIDDTQVKGAPTYKLGVEWRPIDPLLIRASHGTVFRAPDLHNIFKTPSTANVYLGDFVLIDSCRALEAGRPEDILIDGVNMDALAMTCDDAGDFTGFYNATNASVGNRQLKEETGYSNSIGIVWAPFDRTTLAIDYFNIKLKDVVTPESIGNTTLNEWLCLTGNISANSSQCTQAFNNIQRNQIQGFNSYQISTINTSYINTAMQETTGFDIAFNAEHSLGNWGTLRIDTGYTHTLKSRYQHTATDPVDEHYRDNYYNGTFRSKINTIVELLVSDWTLSLAHTRYGSLPNDVSGDDFEQLERGRYAPLNMYNLGVNYQFNDNHQVRLGVVNLFDTRARSDASQTQHPYFKAWAYPQTTVVIGRQFSLAYQVKL